MKLLNILFSIYLIALSAIPCTDVSAAEHQEEMHMEITHSEEDHSDCEDTCAPFCTCSCCGITMAFFYPETISLAPGFSYEQKNTAFILPAFSSFNHSIWQPPKI